MSAGKEKALRLPRRFNSRVLIPLVMAPTISIRPSESTTVPNAEMSASGPVVECCIGQDNGSERSGSRERGPRDIMLTRLRRPSKALTKVKSIMVPISDTFHQVHLKSSYRMIIEIIGGTGECIKLTPETRRVFLHFTKGYTPVRIQASEKRTTIVLEQKQISMTSPPLIGFLWHTSVALSPSGANNLAERRDRHRAWDSEPTARKLGPTVRADVLTGATYNPDHDEHTHGLRLHLNSTPNHTATTVITGDPPNITSRLRQDDDCGSADEGKGCHEWSISPVPTIDVCSVVPYDSATKPTSSPINDVEKPLGTVRTSSIPGTHSVSLAFGPADAGSSDRAIVIRESLAAISPAQGSTQQQDIGDGIMINGEFQALYKGSRRSRRSGIYFGNNITSTSEVRNTLPAASPGLQIMNQYPKMGVVEMGERKNKECLRAHGGNLSMASQDGQDFNTNTPMANGQQQWAAEYENCMDPNPKHKPAALGQAVATPKKKGLPSHKYPAIKVSRRTGFHHYPTDGGLRRRCATAPPSYALPHIPSSETQGEELRLPTHSNKAMKILGIKHKKFLVPRTQEQRNFVVDDQGRDCASAKIVMAEKKTIARRMMSKLGLGGVSKFGKEALSWGGARTTGLS